jgi:hypothetical protein
MSSSSNIPLINKLNEQVNKEYSTHTTDGRLFEMYRNNVYERHFNILITEINKLKEEHNKLKEDIKKKNLL